MIIIQKFLENMFFQNIEWFFAFILANVVVALLTYISLYLQFGRKVVCNCKVNLLNKTVLITGGSRGIGKAAALSFARQGARVLIASSNTFACVQAVQEIKDQTGNHNVDFYQIDLSELSSVQQAANKINAGESHLHILVNNAGIGYHRKAKTKDGYNRIFATNYLGHFLLTYLLVGKLKSSAPSRVVNVTSVCQRLTTRGLDFSLHVPRYGSELFPKLAGYEASKIALVLFNKELARRLAAYNITSNAVHPGICVESQIWTKAKILLPTPLAFSIRETIGLISQDATSCCQTVVHAAVSPLLDGISGQYLERCKLAKCNEQANDATSTRYLWNISMLLTGCTNGGRVISSFACHANYYANEEDSDRHDTMTSREYLLQAKQKPMTSPDRLEIDRNVRVRKKVHLVKRL